MDQFDYLIAIFVVTLAPCLSIATPTRAQPPPAHIDDFAGHPRAIIISDMGNEPDDQMSFVRLLLYSNEIDLEAMIATFDQTDRAELAQAFKVIHRVLNRYGRPKVTKGALVRFIGSLAIANASDDFEGFKRRLVAKAAKIGPNVQAVFQAIEG